MDQRSIPLENLKTVTQICLNIILGSCLLLFTIYSISISSDDVNNQECLAVYHGERYKPTKGRSIELEEITEYRKGKTKTTTKGLECHFGKLDNVE